MKTLKSIETTKLLQSIEKIDKKHGTILVTLYAFDRAIAEFNEIGQVNVVQFFKEMKRRYIKRLFKNKKKIMTLEQVQEIENWEERLDYYLAYNLLEYWKQAEDDEYWEVRLEAFRHTRNWKKAEGDEYWEVKREAFRHTGNWKKAEGDEHWVIGQEAERILKILKDT